jgi:hypothetical protein
MDGQEIGIRFSTDPKISSLSTAYSPALVSMLFPFYRVKGLLSRGQTYLAVNLMNNQQLVGGLGG